ncbi:hypothetical protein [Streptomyces sp. NPDC093970]|uniref:hypothetical protein n=1 Tax=Streptomyces sp. NPDC093970 TaxID=3155076 RepID=UPI003422AAF2
MRTAIQAEPTREGPSPLRLDADVRDPGRQATRGADANLSAGTVRQAAARHHTRLVGEKLTTPMVRILAHELIAVSQRVAEMGKLIGIWCREQRDFVAITRRRDLGVILGTEFLATTRGAMTIKGATRDTDLQSPCSAAMTDINSISPVVTAFAAGGLA